MHSASVEIEQTWLPSGLLKAANIVRRGFAPHNGNGDSNRYNVTSLIVRWFFDFRPLQQPLRAPRTKTEARGDALRGWRAVMRPRHFGQ